MRNLHGPQDGRQRWPEGMATAEQGRGYQQQGVEADGETWQANAKWSFCGRELNSGEDEPGDRAPELQSDDGRELEPAQERVRHAA